MGSKGESLTQQTREQPSDHTDRRDLFNPNVSPVRSDRDRANYIRKALGLRTEMNESVGAVSGKMGELYISHAATIASVNFQNDVVETLNIKLNELAERERNRDLKLNEMAFELLETKATLRNVQKETRENTQELKSKNLVINGIPEKQDENAIGTAVKFIRNIDPNFSAEKIENAYRLGSAGAKGVRGLLIKFKDPKTKQDIMKKKSVLKANKECDKIYCNDDLTEDTRKLRQKLRIIARHAQSLGYQHTRVRGNGLWHEGKLYKENNLSLLPDYLKMENIRTRQIGDSIGFFGKESFMSNHHPARIVMNEHRFLNSEQAFFYYKSVICGHESTGVEIKRILDPIEVKRLGEEIPTCEEWERKKLKVMKSVLVHKFEQYLDLRAKLVNTGTKPLMECTTDLYWGTGRVIDSPNWDNLTDYPGENNLGKILESIRENYLPVTALVDPTAFPMGGNNGANYTSTPMPSSGMKSSKKRRMPSLESKPPAKQKPAGKESGILAVDINSRANTEATPMGPSNTDNDVPQPSASAGSSSPMDATPATDQDNETTPAGDPVTKEKDRLTQSQVLEVDELTFSDTLYQSYDAKNVTNKDGSLNIEKIQSWGLPALNTSRLMEVTGYGSEGSREKLSKLLAAQNTGESYIEMDPTKPTQVESVPRKTLTASRQTGPVSEKKKLDMLLENV